LAFSIAACYSFSPGKLKFYRKVFLGLAYIFANCSAIEVNFCARPYSTVPQLLRNGALGPPAKPSKNPLFRVGLSLAERTGLESLRRSHESHKHKLNNIVDCM